MSNTKIFNDPVYGFIGLPFTTVFEVVEHPWFQRLRRIQQLGLGNLVYPGAIHTRFQHALGAAHLMQKALRVLRSKGHHITDAECEGAVLAILLHDIGHGPFSHTLEQTIVPGLSHEKLSACFMESLNGHFAGKLSVAIEIFNGTYEKAFLHQLVSSQLDVDRMDYLIRDTYFTGVSEGVIGYNRIIDMMDVAGGNLVIEAKGIYSIEKFIIARRIMYWQVYLHKTVLCAEQMLIRCLKRARFLVKKGESVFVTPALGQFLNGNTSTKIVNDDFLEKFACLDDHDIYVALKEWKKSTDTILSRLAGGITDRKLFHIEMQSQPVSVDLSSKLKARVSDYFGIGTDETDYLFFEDTTSNSAYKINLNHIYIKYKDGHLVDVANASDQGNILALSDPVVKHYICFPKEIR